MTKAVLASLILGLLTSAGLPAWAADADGIALQGSNGVTQMLSPGDIGALPAVQVSAPFGGEHTGATFEGPLLWTLLDHAAAVQAAQPRDPLRMAVTVEGHDGYAVVVGLGEILPGFEAKQVILADKQDGQPLPPGHFRLVVPGDKRAGRSIRDVALLAVTLMPAPSLAP